mgnify:CR=1 FL=1
MDRRTRAPILMEEIRKVEHIPEATDRAWNGLLQKRVAEMSMLVEKPSRKRNGKIMAKRMNVK